MCCGDIPFNKFYKDGNLKISGFHEKETGKRTGEWKYFDKDGHMEKVGFYKDGKKTGVLKYLYKNGQIERVGSYEDGQKVGEWHYYKEDGELIMTETYQKFEDPLSIIF